MTNLTDLLPAPLPLAWGEVPAPHPGQRAWRFGPLLVLASIEEDGPERWYHVSVSVARGRVRFEDVQRVRRRFFKAGASVREWRPEGMRTKATHLWQRLEGLS